MQKIRKILTAVSGETALPTNQPTNQPIINNNTDLIGPRWRRCILVQFSGSKDITHKTIYFYSYQKSFKVS